MVDRNIKMAATLAVGASHIALGALRLDSLEIIRPKFGAVLVDLRLAQKDEKILG